ncbi:protein Hook homolog 3 isoform X2 [Centruroides vittatus]|uniref:protein Hook homolog 3 isoform X2 n=1 Tax=Centruroides vittatus TaxID=120091 RepID=UPI00350F9944
MDDITGSLIIWLKTFKVKAPHETVEELSNGVAIAEVLAQIAPDYFHPAWISKIKTDTGSNWRLKVSNLKKILKGVLDYYSEVLGQQITGFRMPDVNAVAELSDPKDLGRLLQLILGCAVNCDKKQEYIETIMGLEESVQHVVMNAIQELMTKEIPSTYSAESIADLNEHLKRVLEELQIATEAKQQITQRCHELDMQVAILQEEKASLLAENDKLLERLNHIESLEDPSTLTGKRFQQMQHKLEVMQDELYKLETARDEYKMKSELQEKEILELSQKNDDLQKLAEEARILKDELDVLRHTSDKVEKYETTIESFKKKLEDLSDLKRQVKLLEDKNTSYVQQNMELEEEVKRAGMLKSQIDMYKKQLQELHSKFSEESRKADKADFENKRLSEKLVSIQQEKDRLIAERDSLKETIEDLRCTQFKNESEMHGDKNGKPSSLLSEAELLESVPPEIKEKLIRLQHENKILKLKLDSNDDQQVAVLQSMLDDSRLRQSELETENRLANQKILEYQSQIQDLQESHSAVSSQEGTELRHKLNNTIRKLKETEMELQKKNITIETLQNQIDSAVQKTHQLQESLNKKEEEMRAMEERYRKYLEKAKNVIKTLDPKKNTTSGSEVIALKNQLLEKEKIIANLEKEAEMARTMREMEERLITTAFYNLGANKQRKAAEERLMQNTSSQTFLSRQRQATSRRLNLPGVATSEFLDY